MAYKEKISLTTDNTIQLGGVNKKTGVKNPTQIEGYYLGVKKIESDYGTGKLHIFQTPEGNVGVWGKTNSNILLTSELVGQMVELTFTGMGKPRKGRQPAYEFKVRHDDENRIDVGSVDLSAPLEEEPEEDLPEYDTNDAEEPEFVPPTKGALSTPSAARQAQVAKLLGSRK